MRKILSLLLLLITLVISGCAADGSDTGGYGRPAGSHGSHH